MNNGLTIKDIKDILNKMSVQDFSESYYGCGVAFDKSELIKVSTERGDKFYVPNTTIHFDITTANRIEDWYMISISNCKDSFGVGKSVFLGSCEYRTNKENIEFAIGDF